MMAEGTIRVATPSDRERIARLVNEAFGVERWLKKGGADRLNETEGELDRLLQRGSFLLLEQEGEAVACVYIEPRGERCYLGLLSVAPARQGQGLGRVVQAAAEAFARAQGCRWMDLRVVSPRRERLVPLYERMGYDETAREEYPPELAEKMTVPGHFILMSKPL